MRAGAEFARVDDGADALRPEAVGAAVPAVPAPQAHVHERRRVSVDFRGRYSAHLVIGPVALGDVAGSAGKATARGQAIVEEEALAELDRCARIARLSASVNCTSSAATAASVAKAPDSSAAALVSILSGYHSPVTIKSDKWIRRMAAKGMIEPFEPGQVKTSEGRKIVSYGTSSYGYDIRCSTEFKIFTNVNSTIIDPKHFDEKNFVDFKGEVCIIPPNSFALARTVEYFRIPRNVLTICLGKSTYARCGIIVNVTPLEPEWEGHVTLEFSNTTPLPARIYANEGVAQVIFIESDEPCETSYRERGGKYQGQRGVTLPRI